jgi:hypothetical protein
LLDHLDSLNRGKLFQGSLIFGFQEFNQEPLGLIGFCPHLKNGLFSATFFGETNVEVSVLLGALQD